MTAKELFSIHHRLRRKHFVFVWLAAFALTLSLLLVWFATGINEIFYLRYLLVVAVIPATIRRLHDMGYSGWLIIGVFLMPIAVLLLLCLPGVPGTNAYGPNPKTQVA